jgi:hypothetical protein
MVEQGESPVHLLPSSRSFAVVSLLFSVISGATLYAAFRTSNYVWLLIAGPSVAIAMIGLFLKVRRTPSALLYGDHLSFRRGVRYIDLPYSDITNVILVGSGSGAGDTLVLSIRDGQSIRWGRMAFQENLVTIGKMVSERVGIPLSGEM